jgi:hypothetical protein
MPYPDSTYEQQWREARGNAPFILVPVHSGHTPGPWHANGCCIEAPGDEGPRDVTIAVVHGQRLDADARLIAAAPEMLNALRLCLEMEDGPNGHPCYCDEQYFEGGRCHTCTALSAIAKAEGRE